MLLALAIFCVALGSTHGAGAPGLGQLCPQQGKTIFGSVAVPAAAAVCVLPTACQVRCFEGPLSTTCRCTLRSPSLTAKHLISTTQ